MMFNPIPAVKSIRVESLSHKGSFESGPKLCSYLPKETHRVLFKHTEHCMWKQKKA